MSVAELEALVQAKDNNLGWIIQRYPNSLLLFEHLDPEAEARFMLFLDRLLFTRPGLWFGPLPPKAVEDWDRELEELFQVIQQYEEWRQGRIKIHYSSNFQEFIFETPEGSCSVTMRSRPRCTCPLSTSTASFARIPCRHYLLLKVVGVAWETSGG